MPGSIKVYYPANTDIDDEDLALSIVREARTRTKLPKRVSIFGAYGSWIAISYTTNVIRDTIVDVIQSRGLSFDIR